MKRIIFFVLAFCLATKAYAQLPTIINEFVPAFQMGDQDFVKRAENNIYYLKGKEKTQEL